MTMCTMPFTYMATDPKIFIRLISKLEPVKKRRRMEFDKAYIVCLNFIQLKTKLSKSTWLDALEPNA